MTNPTSTSRPLGTSCRGAAALVSAALLVSLTPAAATAAQPEDVPSTFLVTTAPGTLGAFVEDVPGSGADVIRELDGIGMAVIEGTAAEVEALAADPRVASITPDSGVVMLGDGYETYDPKADANSMYNVTSTIGAQWMWRDTAGRLKWTGRGVDVAVLDSGVTPVEGLATAGKVINGPDLSFDSQSASTRYLDTFGHGTHMAGIIAGKDAGADPSDGDDTSFMGVAPDARIVNVKVADGVGNADVSQIIAGIDWVVQHRKSDGLNIRVLNLSLGTPSRQSYLLDPLAYAAEQAWHKGIVVVVAAGNDGTGTGKLLNPAQNPYVLAVGANDTKGTNPTGDDVIPDFSTRGDGVRNPDLVAHGTSIQSLRVPGSLIDQQYGATAAIDERFLRGSGTSQAAAATSGAVALLLQRNPGWTPDDVKARLVAKARPLPSADRQAQGKGMVDLRRVDFGTKTSYSKQSFAKAKGTGSLDAARGGYRLTNDLGVVLDGERDVFGETFDAKEQSDLSAGDAAWVGGTWNASAWTGVGMTTAGWASTTWSGGDWSGQPWGERASGGTWTARMWADGYWSARMWAARMWAARMWATGTWQ